MIGALARTLQPALATWLHPTPLRFLHLADMSRRSGRLSASSVPSASTSTSLSSRASSSKSTVPYFEEWPTEALQAEVKRYGFKVSRKRATLIDQLKAVYAALEQFDAAFEPPQHPLPADGDAMQYGAPPREPARKRKLILPTSAETGAGKGKGRGRKSDPFVLDASSDSAPSSQPESGLEQGGADEPGDLTAQLEREALSATDGSTDSADSDVPLSASNSPIKQRRRRSASARSSSSEDVPLSRRQVEEEGDGEVVDPSPVLAEIMTAAMRGSPAVWGRILRFEPISFDEVVSMATTHGLAMDTGKRKEELRTWLDRQCICFYSNDLTGTRARH
ncbi:uncharacterized protein PAN0_016c5304 [Moesziomyces antarcticus]|uniref:Structure-specific endonuclease subunit SLX4 n=2 Tax=Pseudozyma antarctica TaxID=84753 RepID=A0A081CK82_PSEA2|nr:uncharacterized protein PAN0_016c5304 [Moesziomyces antarcticus]GAK67078.1 conserved hypothetical protein [Moesziomyces antarcticus]